MNIRKIYTGFRAALLLAAALLLVACGSSAIKKGDVNSKGGVSEIDTNAIERWNLLIAGKPEKAYDYLTPGYKKTKARETYAAEMGNRPVHWSKVQFLGKDCDETVCHVRLLVDFSINVNVGTAHEASSVEVIKEDWLNLDGHWYYLPPALGATAPK